MADAAEPCEDCGPSPSLGFWLLAGGAVMVLLGLDLLTMGKIFDWLPWFSSTPPAEVKDS